MGIESMQGSALQSVAQMPQGSLAGAVATDVLKKAIDIESQAVSTLIASAAPADVRTLPAHLGSLFNASA